MASEDAREAQRLEALEAQAAKTEDDGAKVTTADLRTPKIGGSLKDSLKDRNL